MTALVNRNCLITGASRGLGAKIAAAFWEAGANLMLVAHSSESLEKVARGLGVCSGQRVVTMTANLQDSLAPERIIAAARAEFDELDVLVNNAAVQGPIGLTWMNDPAEWQLALQVNLVAPVALCRLCVPWMAEQGRGKIINLSGGGATGPRANFSAYATAKAGLARFSETLAEETRALGIDVNCVAPGAMDTAMLEAVLQAGPAVAGQKEYDAALRVRRQQGGALPERAAALCVFLASSACDDITGKLISAVWDPWETCTEHREDLAKTDIYTLRRIVPQDRGRAWGER